MPPFASSGGSLIAVSRPGLAGAADPISHLLAVLRPRAAAIAAVADDTTGAFGGFAWHQSAFCIVMCGRGVVDAGARGICIAGPGDFIVLPDASRFTVAGLESGARCLVGTIDCDCVEPALFQALLPPVLHIRASVRQEWLATVLEQEVGWEPNGGPVMLDRLVETMLVDVLRQATAGPSPPGLLQGLGDARLAPALHGIHAQLDHPWTVAELAGLTDLRRSAFHVRFTLRLGASPMDYLLSWRMLVARELMRSGSGSGRVRRGLIGGLRAAGSCQDGLTLSDIARRVGYGCTATFIRAFRRHAGQTPGRFARVASV